MTSGVKSLVFPLCGLALLLIFGGCGKSPHETVAVRPLIFSGPTMGTYYRVTLAAEPADFPHDKIKAVIEDRLDDINAKMSTYRADSELSRFNQYRGTDWFPVSGDTATVVTEALQIHRLTGGAFDITVGPLVNLWGFGPPEKRTEPPAQDKIESARDKIGSQHLQVRPSPPALKKDIGDLYVDLSAIAKGYAVDAVAKSLESMGIVDFIVDIGGDMLAKGRKKDSSFWKIAIESPIVEDREIQRAIGVSNLAVATSGDYRNYFEANGQRYSHEINPRTGWPIRHALASVTVLDPSCMRADAWATALIVLGPVEGFKMVEKRNLEAYFIIKGEDGFLEKETRGFKQMSINRP